MIDRLWVIKVGGSIISCESGANFFNDQVIRRIVGFIKSLEEPVIVTHGTGFISKEFARNRPIINRRIERYHTKTTSECLLMLREINLHMLRLFIDAGIPAVSLSPFTYCEFSDGRLNIRQPEIIKYLLTNHYVPLIHGDLALDCHHEFCICSSDSLLCSIVRYFPADTILFATDVAGIYPRDPGIFPGEEKIGVLDRAALKILIREPDSRDDVSGGMPAKLKEIAQVLDCFRHCYIFDGTIPDEWHRLIHLRKHAGTYIRGNLDKGERV
jgi:isopentenyl phosphate kinase